MSIIPQLAADDGLPRGHHQRSTVEGKSSAAYAAQIPKPIARQLVRARTGPDPPPSMASDELGAIAALHYGQDAKETKKGVSPHLIVS